MNMKYSPVSYRRLSGLNHYPTMQISLNILKPLTLIDSIAGFALHARRPGIMPLHYPAALSIIQRSLLHSEGGLLS